MAFVLSAVHLWIHLGIPQFIYWWEMELIADRLGDADEVASIAREHGLGFPVGMAAEYVGRLWKHDLCLELGRDLLSNLRLAERMALAGARRRGVDSMTLRRMYAARILSRRPSRMGVKSVFRQVWPHPGVVESSTPGDMPWWRRRLLATARRIGIARR